jgi:hypothetical protein
MKDHEEVSSRKLIDRLIPDLRWGSMQGMVATTYELRPDFLELDFLPSVFGLGTWDDRNWATRIALEKRLFELEAAVIFAEARRYRGRPRSLRLQLKPVVSSHGSALHAKVTLLLFDKAVRLVVASANLTEQGYRRNREVAAVITASQNSRKDAYLISQAVDGMRSVLAPWITPEAEKILRSSLETLKPWMNDTTDPSASFVWSNGLSRLWRVFLNRWPAGETVSRISILSPFWSEDAGITLSSFLSELRAMDVLDQGAEVRLFTDAFKQPDGTFIPVLPAGYATYNWKALGVRATAQAVNPEVHPVELGGMEGFTGTRALHAKIVFVEGTKNNQAYLGSANFTAHGWGFLEGGQAANLEAGLVLCRSNQSPVWNTILPDVVGKPVVLGEGEGGTLQPPESVPDDAPWPEFVREVVLSPNPARENELELRIEVAPGSDRLGWSVATPNADGRPAKVLISSEDTQTAAVTKFLIPLSAETLTCLLTEQELSISWLNCPSGRPFPLNVDADARIRLPICPNSQRIQESHLLSYYQGRIAWEDLFPDPDQPQHDREDPSQSNSPEAGVDKSRIQSYQIREFVEALTGLGQDLKAATQSEPSMRLALLGPVSPVALAATVLEEARADRRSPTAGAFQLVEILACLNSARLFAVAEKLSEAWHIHLNEASGKVNRMLDQLVAEHRDQLDENRSFRRYRTAVLAAGKRFGT